MIRRPPSSTLPYTLFPYTTRCRSVPGHRLSTVAGLLPVTTGFGHYRQPLHRGTARTTLAHNNSFKPNALRYTNNMAGKACHVVGSRSEERRVGKECVRPCRSRWSTCHDKKKHIHSIDR